MVKLSNESESGTNIDLEEAAALWAVAADPGLPLSTPLAVSGAERPARGRRPPGDRGVALPPRLRPAARAGPSLSGADLTGSTVVAYGAMTARTARALRGFFHPAAGRRVLWHVEEREQTRRAHRPHRRPRDPQPGGGGVRRLRGAGGAALGGAAGPGRPRRPHARQPARRRRGRDRRARPRRPHPLDARLRHRGRVRLARPRRVQGDAPVPYAPAVPRRLPLGDAAGARGAGRPRRHDRAARGDHAVHLALAGGRPPRERGVHPGLGRRSR